jgi:NAD(P)-dependent dehydrogenase (short-subunit alcohol dehydrogenase family)
MNKVILITGASSGIGKTTAEFLSTKGFRVYGTSRNPDSRERSFTLLPLDVCNVESIRKAVDTILEREGRIDVLVNNAGMGITGPLEDTPTEEMKRVFDTNFFGPIEVMKAVLPAMREQGGGLIINITSIAGYMGLPFRGIYSATKGALELVTESARMELRSFGIQLTNIAPGDFATSIATGRYHAPVQVDSPYREIYQRSLDLMDEHVDSGGDPIEMARKIHRVIQKSSPSVRYKVGAFMQKFSIVLKRLLPSKWYERLLMNHYRI